MDWLRWYTHPSSQFLDSQQHLVICRLPFDLHDLQVALRTFCTTQHVFGLFCRDRSWGHKCFLAQDTLSSPVRWFEIHSIVHLHTSMIY